MFVAVVPLLLLSAGVGVGGGGEHFESSLGGVEHLKGGVWEGLTELLLHETLSASPAWAGRAQNSPRDLLFLSRRMRKTMVSQIPSSLSTPVWVAAR